MIKTRVKTEPLELKLLFVEDDAAIQEATKIHLKKYVSELIIASNGQEGLEFYKSKSPDVIMSDIEMPKLDGLDMSKEIRKLDEEIPIIIMSAFSDSSYLLKSIEVGITVFLIKPIEIKKMASALKKAYTIVKSQKLQKEIEEKNRELNYNNDILEDAYEQLRVAKERELELHIYKDRYHTLQQQMAFKKQQKIIVDELSFIYENGIFFSTFYKPLDILSGDSYGTFRVCENRYFFYIIDAMGKGLSASVTSIQSISHINYNLLKNRGKNFDIKELINSFLDFIKNQLLDEEMLCAIFLYQNFDEEKIEIVNFSMPPVLIENDDGNIEEITSLNPPITKNRKDFKVNIKESYRFKKMLIYSDGLVETQCKNGELFQNHLESSFESAFTLNDIVSRFKKMTKDSQDDTTLIFLNRLDLTNKKKSSYKIGTSIDKFCEINSKILQNCAIYLDKLDNSKLNSALFEIGFNAVEHGNLGITYNQKRALIVNGEYDEYLQNRLEEKNDRAIFIDTYELKVKDDTILIIVVLDEGDGFNVASVLKLVKSTDMSNFNGRGIKMANDNTDGIYYNIAGNRAVIIKKLGSIK